MQEEGEKRKPVRKVITGCTQHQADISALNPTIATGNQAEAKGMVQKESTISLLERMQGTGGGAVHHVSQCPVTPQTLLGSHAKMQAIVQPRLSQEIPPFPHS